jgi:hypothetical protein
MPQKIADRLLSAMSFIVLSVCMACDGGQLTPVGPTESAIGDDRLIDQVRLQWSPYLGVHVTAEALDTYRDALSTLRSKGQLRGVRVELNPNLSPNDQAIRTIRSTGVELLALMSNEYLFVDNIEREFDEVFADYPEIRYFQIGNEVTTILPVDGPTIDIAGYMAVFRRVYDHVQDRHKGRVVLLTQSPLGSGSRGARELQAMVDHGLLELDPNQVVIGINSYDLDSAAQYLGLLGGALRKYRVWVTESGIRDPKLHISWVQENYPRLRNLLRAERIYWYTLWGGDVGSDTEFGLIKQPGNYPNYWRSPLFSVLTAER